MNLGKKTSFFSSSLSVSNDNHFHFLAVRPKGDQNKNIIIVALVSMVLTSVFVILWVLCSCFLLVVMKTSMLLLETLWLTMYTVAHAVVKRNYDNDSYHYHYSFPLLLLTLLLTLVLSLFHQYHVIHDIDNEIEIYVTIQITEINKSCISVFQWSLSYWEFQRIRFVIINICSTLVARAVQYSSKELYIYFFILFLFFHIACHIHFPLESRASECSIIVSKLQPCILDIHWTNIYTCTTITKLRCWIH